MKVNDILQITEYGTNLRIFDSQTVETAVEGMLLQGNYNDFAKYGDKMVLAINTNDESINFELVVK